jgi:hypothetical protein
LFGSGPLEPAFSSRLAENNMAKKWRDVQKEIKQLYLTQDKPLKEVQTLMKERHSFERSRVFHRLLVELQLTVKDTILQDSSGEVAVPEIQMRTPFCNSNLIPE